MAYSSSPSSSSQPDSGFASRSCSNSPNDSGNNSTTNCDQMKSTSEDVDVFSLLHSRINQAMRSGLKILTTDTTLLHGYHQAFDEEMILKPDADTIVSNFFIVRDQTEFEAIYDYHAVEQSEVCIIGDAKINGERYLVYIKFGTMFVSWDQDFNVAYVGVTSHHGDSDDKRYYTFEVADPKCVPEYRLVFEECVQLCQTMGKLFGGSARAEQALRFGDGSKTTDEILVENEDDEEDQELDDNEKEADQLSSDVSKAGDSSYTTKMRMNHAAAMEEEKERVANLKAEIREDFLAVCQSEKGVIRRKVRQLADFILGQAKSLDSGTFAVKGTDGDFLLCTKLVYDFLKEHLKLSDEELVKIGDALGIADQIIDSFELEQIRKRRRLLAARESGYAKRYVPISSNAKTASTTLTKSVIGRHIPMFVGLSDDRRIKADSKVVDPKSSGLKPAVGAIEFGAATRSEVKVGSVFADGDSNFRHQFASAALSIRKRTTGAEETVTFVVERGDCVEVIVGRKEEDSSHTKLFLIVDIFEEDGEKPYCHGIELMRATDETSLIGSVARSNELLFVAGKCEPKINMRRVVRRVVLVPKLPTGAGQKSHTSHELLTEYDTTYGDNSYFLQYCYDIHSGKYFYDEEVHHFCFTSVKSATAFHRCVSCDISKRDEQSAVPTMVGSKTLTYSNQRLTVGSCVMLQSNALKKSFRVWKRNHIPEGELQKRLMEFREDPELYKEFDRFDRTRELAAEKLNALANPLAAALITDVKVDENHVISLLLRLFYRAEDSAVSDEEARCVHPGALYLSEDKHWFALDEENLELFAGQCYVYAYNERDTLTAYVHQWFEEGDYRAFCSKTVSEASNFLPEDGLSPTLIDLINKSRADEVTFEHATVEKPLASLDIFCGAGGLTCGLEQAGLCKVRYAVDFNKDHANAFKGNFPDATVFFDDVNALFDMITNSSKTKNKLGQQLPQKGEVEMIVGGPPCQGFSSLNNFKTGAAAAEKRSQIAAFLAYCDHFRPERVMLENVGGMATAINKVQVIPVLVEAFRALNYQVVVCKLQAAQYSVPQNRKRIFVICAAPGHRLPEIPKPVTSCAKVLAISNRDDGNKVLKINRALTIVPPHHTVCKYEGWLRGVSVRDAIDDMPSIRMHHKEDVYKTNEHNKTYYQSSLSTPSLEVTDHTTESLSVLKLARVERIPFADYIPGADWRFLPNEAATLINGHRTRPLEYKYGACILSTDRKPQKHRGICSVCVGKGCGRTGQSNFPINTIIPPTFPHTATVKGQWKGCYGRVVLDEHFPTIVTNPEPGNKQGRVLHPYQHRLLSVRELARGQSFPDSFQFTFEGQKKPALKARFEQIGNAVPPLLSRAIGRATARAVAKDEKRKK